LNNCITRKTIASRAKNEAPFYSFNENGHSIFNLHDPSQLTTRKEPQEAATGHHDKALVLSHHYATRTQLFSAQILAFMSAQQEHSALARLVGVPQVARKLAQDTRRIFSTLGRIDSI
jgi:hypothetical protein